MARQVVKRVKGAAVAMMTVPPLVAKAVTVPAAVRRSDAQLVASMCIPTGSFPVSKDIKDYTFLLYAAPGWGKTILLSTFPSAAFMPTERGFKGIPNIHTLGPPETGGTITTWPQFLRAVELLESSDQYQNVAIDTIDKAYAHCSKHICKDAGVKHPSQGKDRGKLWNDITEEIMTALSRISATGRGLYITSHVREDNVERASGTDYTRIGPNLSPSTAKNLIAFVDFCFYGDYVGASGTGVNRVLFTQGDELIVGKNRKIGTGVKLPEAILLPEDETLDYEYLKAMFEGRLKGVDIASLRESGRTSKTVSTKMVITKAESALAQLQGKGVTGA